MGCPVPTIPTEEWQAPAMTIHPHALKMAGGVVLLVASLGRAEVYFVAPNGSAGGDGSKARPFASLQAAASILKAGDTVLVEAGRCQGGFSISTSGAPEQPITVRALSPHAVKIESRVERITTLGKEPNAKHTYTVADSGPVAGVTIDLGTTPMVVEGLAAAPSVAEVDARPRRFHYGEKMRRLWLRYLMANPARHHTVHVLRDPVGILVTGSNVVVDGFAVSGFARAGITVSGAENVALSNCDVSHCGSSWGAGIGLHATRGAIVRGCRIIRSMNGVFLHSSERTYLGHNTLFATRAHGLMLVRATDTIIRNNILCAGGPSGSTLYVDEHSDKRLGLREGASP